jgi:hypothetical protein
MTAALVSDVENNALPTVEINRADDDAVAVIGSVVFAAAFVAVATLA